MKKSWAAVFAIFILCMSNAMAEDITGTWQGKLVTGPGAEMTIQFIITQEDSGPLTVILNSPDIGALKNVPASSANLDGKTLKIEWSSIESDFEGSIKDNAIDGQWLQAGMSFPLSLSPYTHTKISREDVDKFLCSWHGKLMIPPPTGALMVGFRFELSEEEGLIGYLDAPEQGTYDAKIPKVDIEGNDLTVTFGQGNTFKGQLSEDKISGQWTGGGGPPLPLSLEKGALGIPVNTLNLPEESQDLLMGKWHGTVTLPQASLTIVFRFEKLKDDFMGFLDIPDQGLSGAVISEAQLNGDNVIIKLNVLNILFDGQFSEESIKGKLARGGRTTELNLVRGDVPPLKLNLSGSSMNQLVGLWRGTLNTPQGSFRIALRFEKTEQGDFVGFYDNLDRGARGIPITEATLKEGAFALKIDSIRVEYKGSLSGNTLTGQFSSSGRSTDVVLERIM